MILYLKVTSDEYELPLSVASSIDELSKHLGVSKNNIKLAMEKAKEKGWKCSYIQVEVEDERKSIVELDVNELIHRLLEIRNDCSDLETYEELTDLIDELGEYTNG